MKKNNFYTLIPPMPHIGEITNPIHYYDVPPDWYIAMTDVRGSTKAITEGRYKEVCAVAAAGIAAQLNVMDGADIPFVFGGDGASLLMPPEKYDQSRAALAGTRRMAAEQFGLELRAAIIPVKHVIESGHAIRVARLEMSPDFQQAIFNGGGMRHAEMLMKDAEHGARYTVGDDVEPDANFHGVECRWNRVRSPNEENVSLIVMATGESVAQQNTTYSAVLREIERIYGDSITRHPIAIPNLKMSFKPRNLSVEGRIRHENQFNWKTLLRMMRGSYMARVAMWFNIGQWGTYKRHLFEATDHEKFDDTLRMIISGTADQREALITYLESERQRGSLVYGTHVSGFALVTCIVYDYFGRQMHLVDGADGGYALAAQQLKAQLDI